MGVLRHIPEPDSVLDIGVGFGKFGFLFRETLDIRKRRYSPTEWQAIIDGVEIWDGYITPVHDYVYSQIFIGDIRKLVHDLHSYDLIVLADVIEHMPYEEGAQLLKTLFYQHCNLAMVISYPPVIGSDWKNWQNPHEKHHCVWTKQLIASAIPGVKLVSPMRNNPQVVYVFKGD